MASNNFVEYDGIRFYKAKTGYWIGHIGNRPNRCPKRLHIYVWEKENGKIPKGYDIHHKDQNKSNNELGNLELVNRTEHRRSHSTTDEAIAKARISIKKAIEAAAKRTRTEKDIEQSKINWANGLGKLVGQKLTNNCLFCGKEFQYSAIQPNSKYCSNACKSASRRASGKDNETRECVVCGIEYQTNKYLPAMTCGKDCRKLYQGMIVRERNGKSC